jgi:uncharacterized repeat protein (TIGR03943 family)
MTSIEHSHHDHSHDESCEHDSAHPHAEEAINWERVQCWVQVGILFLLALYLIDLSLPGGNLANYINVANFGWLTWVGAIILLLVAALNSYDLLRQSDDEHHHHHDHDHNHAKAGSAASWFFLAVSSIPLMLGLAIPSEPLGADAVSELSSDVRSIGFTNDPTSVVAPENRNLLDWVRAFALSPDMSDFEGQTVEVIGFVYRDARFAGTQNFMVVRFTLSCCVADARPIGLIVEAPPGQSFEQDTWVNVQGKVAIRNLDGVDTPVIVPTSIEITTEPEQPYLYF